MARAFGGYRGQVALYGQDLADDTQLFTLGSLLRSRLQGGQKVKIFDNQTWTGGSDSLRSQKIYPQQFGPLITLYGQVSAVVKSRVYPHTLDICIDYHHTASTVETNLMASTTNGTGWIDSGQRISVHVLNNTDPAHFSFTFLSSAAVASLRIPDLLARYDSLSFDVVCTMKS